MIVGIGIDICEVSRMAAFLERQGVRAHDRLFSPEEVRYCLRRVPAAQSFAARFAAKEAVMKLLGTGWSGGIRWRDIEIVGAADSPPAIRLHGAAAEHAERRGIARIHLSITHSRDSALAQVIGETA